MFLNVGIFLETGYPLQCYYCGHRDWQPNPLAQCEQEQEIQNCTDSEKACINLYLSSRTDDGSVEEVVVKGCASHLCCVSFKLNRPTKDRTVIQIRLTRQ